MNAHALNDRVLQLHPRTVYLHFRIWKCKATPKQFVQLCLVCKLWLRSFWKRVSEHNELSDWRMITFLAKLAKYAVSYANTHLQLYIKFGEDNKHVWNATFETVEQRPECFFNCRITGLQRCRLWFYSGAYQDRPTCGIILKPSSVSNRHRDDNVNLLKFLQSLKVKIKQSQVSCCIYLSII